MQNQNRLPVKYLPKNIRLIFLSIGLLVFFQSFYFCAIGQHSASLARELNTLGERVASFNTLLNNNNLAGN